MTFANREEFVQWCMTRADLLYIRAWHGGKLDSVPLADVSEKTRQEWLDMAWTVQLERMGKAE